jgi:glycerol-3-phosphate acyltransferase PlsX
MRVAVDAMGGDHAPHEIVQGALIALEKSPELSVLLVGDEARIRPLIEEAGGVDRSRIDIRHASEVIEMGESPVVALRQKPDSSIQRCIEALREGEVDAMLSAGDTGGVVAAATLFLPRLKGVKRHGIGIPFPTVKGRTLLCDVGANIRAKPIHLLQYAIMSCAYVQEVMGIEDPTVGVLSIGEEEGKGTDLVKKTQDLLTRAGMNYVGNVEGSQIFQGVADVIVCDGFVGNVVLKVAEGVAEAFLHTIVKQAGGAAAGSPEFAKILGSMTERLDYSKTGGAPLLGVAGSVVICHGRSKSTAIANAIGVAHSFSDSGVNDRIVEGVAKLGMLSRMADFLHIDRDS